MVYERFIWCSLPASPAFSPTTLSLFTNLLARFYLSIFAVLFLLSGIPFPRVSPWIFPSLLLGVCSISPYLSGLSHLNCHHSPFPYPVWLFSKTRTLSGIILHTYFVVCCLYYSCLCYSTGSSTSHALLFLQGLEQCKHIVSFECVNLIHVPSLYNTLVKLWLRVWKKTFWNFSMA